MIDAGATTINIPDTVGYAIPSEFGELIRIVRERVPNIGRAVLSVHCHDDLGLGVANSLAAVQNGAGQVECTVNGIGERAGNASLEEIVMALKTRPALFDATTGIHTEEITRTSRLLASITGIDVQPNKAIVGSNAFAHESGIHQDGVLKDARTYEIMTPESVGLSKVQLVLGKHSGRHAFAKRLQELGYELTKEQVGERLRALQGPLRQEEGDLRRRPHRARRAGDPRGGARDLGARVPGDHERHPLHPDRDRGPAPRRGDAPGLGDRATGRWTRPTTPWTASPGVTGTLVSYQIRAVTSGQGRARRGEHQGAVRRAAARSPRARSRRTSSSPRCAPTSRR